MKKDGSAGGQSGAIVVLQRRSSDLRLNPHLHVVFLDGVYHEHGEQVLFRELPRLSTREVGSVLQQAVRRIARHLARRGLLDEPSGGGDADDTEPSAAR